MGGVLLHPKCCCWRYSMLIHPNLSAALRRELRRKLIGLFIVPLKGLFREYTAGNVGVRELEIALDIVPVASVQNRYNLSDRSSEAVLQACEREDSYLGTRWLQGDWRGRVDLARRSPGATTPPHHR
jgi:hypothetical protein